jgi:argininosuccinate lyase
MSEVAAKYNYSVSLGSHDSRLKKGAAEVVVENFYSRWLDGTRPYFAKLLEYNQAHVVELHDRGVISRDDAAKLLETLRWIEAQGIGHFAMDPHLEDLMPNIEGIVVSRLGEAVGGKLLTGRARGEVTNVGIRLLLRENYLDMMQALNELRRVLLVLAEEHVETVMPGYTHAQHAQPTTFGHYLAGVAEALETDFARLEDTWKRLNESFAESGIGQGTAYPIDRARVAELLGFEGVVENTRYALLSWDRTVEVLAMASILALNMNRFSDDLFYWCTYEFGMVELADEFSATSYIMPQKKNPYVLEELAVIPGRAVTAFTQEAFRWNRVSYGMATHIGGVKTDPSKTVAEVAGAAKMLAGVVSTLTVHSDVMRERAGIHFTQASELADTLAREKGLSFRTAHRIMGTVVREALGKGIHPHDIDVAMIDAAAREVTGQALGLAPEVLARALDSREITRSRKVFGGTAPEAVRASLANRASRLARDTDAAQAKLAAVAAARAKLETAVVALLA